ncbi:MAG: ATPase [Bacteroidales bacterium]|nr:ATPase [Bacteroidales bacterium]
MKKTTVTPLLGLLALCCSASAFGNSSSPATGDTDNIRPVETDKLKITPIGTLLMDGALYASPQKSEFPDGVCIPDVRLGVTASIGRHWNAKIEVGYAYNKVLLKDVWMQYDFSATDQLRVGLQMQHFGYQNSTAACMKVTMIEPVSNSVFNEGHMIGLTWYHNADKYFTTLSAHAEPKTSSLLLGKDEMRREGYGLRTRLVARPLHKEGLMVQAGVSGAFLTPQYNGGSGKEDTHDSFSFGANFPTKVTLHSAIHSTVSHAMNLWKFTPELMFCYGRAAIESQYFFMQVNRRQGLPAYRATGAYATLRGIILGQDYTYNMAVAGIATPRPKSLEGVVSYNYTSLSDSRSMIFGGRLNDISVGLNYYINRYMVAKLRYGYTHTWDRADTPSMSLNTVQARLQFIF